MLWLKSLILKRCSAFILSLSLLLAHFSPEARRADGRVCGIHHGRSQIFQHVERRRQTEAGGLERWTSSPRLCCLIRVFCTWFARLQGGAGSSIHHHRYLYPLPLISNFTCFFFLWMQCFFWTLHSLCCWPIGEFLLLRDFSFVAQEVEFLIMLLLVSTLSQMFLLKFQFSWN